MPNWNQGKAVDAQTKDAKTKQKVVDKEADESVLRAAKFLKTGVAPDEESEADQTNQNPKTTKKTKN